MRPLFLFLVLINLGYFVWQWQQRGDEKPLPDGPIAVAPHSKTLTLLSELPASPGTGTTAPGNNAQQDSPSRAPNAENH